MPVPTAMSTPTVKPTAVETTEVARMCKTVEIRRMSELMVFLAAAEKAGSFGAPGFSPFSGFSENFMSGCELFTSGRCHELGSDRILDCVADDTINL